MPTEEQVAQGKAAVRSQMAKDPMVVWWSVSYNRWVVNDAGTGVEMAQPKSLVVVTGLARYRRAKDPHKVLGGYVRLDATTPPRRVAEVVCSPDRAPYWVWRDTGMRYKDVTVAWCREDGTVWAEPPVVKLLAKKNGRPPSETQLRTIEKSLHRAGASWYLTDRQPLRLAALEQQEASYWIAIHTPGAEDVPRCFPSLAGVLGWCAQERGEDVYRSPGGDEESPAPIKIDHQSQEYRAFRTRLMMGGAKLLYSQAQPVVAPGESQPKFWFSDEDGKVWSYDSMAAVVGWMDQAGY